MHACVRVLILPLFYGYQNIIGHSITQKYTHIESPKSTSNQNTLDSHFSFFQNLKIPFIWLHAIPLAFQGHLDSKGASLRALPWRSLSHNLPFFIFSFLSSQMHQNTCNLSTNYTKGGRQQNYSCMHFGSLLWPTRCLLGPL